MDLVKLFEVVKMVGIGVCIILVSFVGLSYVIFQHGFSDEVNLPWEKEERRREQTSRKRE